MVDQCAIKEKMEKILYIQFKTKLNVMKTTTKTKWEKFEKFFQKLEGSEFDGSSVLDYVWEEDLEDIHTFDCLINVLHDKNYFHQESEIIYYHNAMKYLMENDNSLMVSLEYANEQGYEVKNLNSEILATLLKEKNLIDDFYYYENEINEFLIKL